MKQKQFSEKLLNDKWKGEEINMKLNFQNKSILLWMMNNFGLMEC